MFGYPGWLACGRARPQEPRGHRWRAPGAPQALRATRTHAPDGLERVSNSFGNFYFSQKNDDLGNFPISENRPKIGNPPPNTARPVPFTFKEI